MHTHHVNVTNGYASSIDEQLKTVVLQSRSDVSNLVSNCDPTESGSLRIKKYTSHPAIPAIRLLKCKLKSSHGRPCPFEVKLTCAPGSQTW